MFAKYVANTEGCKKPREIGQLANRATVFDRMSSIY